jgi:acyl transferase domain-containing protein
MDSLLQRILVASAHSQVRSTTYNTPCGDMARGGVFTCREHCMKANLLSAATSGSFSVAAGRLSFVYGFKGPAVSMDTACSSALVSTHIGAMQLQTAPQVASLAAGVNLLLSENTFAATQAAGMLTVDGRCKTLDTGADGYVRAEACTAFLLTSKVQALDIDGVCLRGSFTNQDGRSSSLTAPNGPSQQAVIRGALDAAACPPSDVCGLEMHGTGQLLDRHLL